MKDEEGRSEVLEAMAQAYYEWSTMNPGEMSRWDLPGPHRQHALARAEVMLGGLEAAGFAVSSRIPRSIRSPAQNEPEVPGA